MKIPLGFLSGMIVSGLLLWGVQSAIPIQAQSENSSLTESLTELLPDIEKIYQEALIFPLQEAEQKIYDEDIAQFYHQLLERSALDKIESGTN